MLKNTLFFFFSAQFCLLDNDIMKKKIPRFPRDPYGLETIQNNLATTQLDSETTQNTLTCPSNHHCYVISDVLGITIAGNIFQ